MASKKSSKKEKFDVSSHILVPKHTLLSAKEKEKVLKRYNLEALPSININDPAIASMNANVGDVVKIERNSPTAKIHIYYRRVINE